MTAPNGKREGILVPLAAILPRGAVRPRFYLVAQWETPAGLLCPKRPVQASPISPQQVIELFAQLVGAGRIQQVVKGENGEDVLAPIDISVVYVPPQPAPTPEG